jgi:hypothetical protein
MSKTKLALLVFGIAFGVNLAAFLLSKKAFTVDEVKSVWIYEIPGTASPADAYVAADLGPHQGIIGTLFAPDHLTGKQALSPLLVDTWTWNQDTRTLDLRLKPGLKYQNGDPVLPAHFLLFREFLKEKGLRLGSSGVWSDWLGMRGEATEGGLKFILSSDDRDFDLEEFLSEVLTHPLSGAVHPSNMERIRAGARLSKEWISSGPYKVRKWNPKEIVLVSRNDFPVRLPDPFFRTLKYQSAPVKNPSCDFLFGKPDEATVLSDHSRQDTSLELSVFWVCRSFRQQGVCKDPDVRELLARSLSGVGSIAPDALKGRTVRYRIPVGSDSFRDRIRKQIEERVSASGGRVEETSFFFKESSETDLELEFVVTPGGGIRKELAPALAVLSTRLGVDAARESHLLGEVEHFSLSVFMKKMKGGIFGKVFLEPDLDEKRMPL